MTNKPGNIILMILLISAAAYAGDIKGKIEVDNKGINNVVVYLKPVKKISFPISNKIAVMDQIDLNFVPHVLPVQVGTKTVFPNSDKIRHSVFSMSGIKKFDFGTYPPGKEKAIVCGEKGVISILCYIHHDMSAYIVVLETPYFSLTNENGEYLIKNIPSGNYEVSFWHENAEMIEQLKSEQIFIPSDNNLIKNFSIGK